MIPLLASFCFMFGVVNGSASGSLLAGATFLVLGAFLFSAIFGLSKVWDQGQE